MIYDITKIWYDTHDYLARFIQKRVGNKDEVNDIIQEVFLKVQLKLPTLKEGEKLVPWIFSITRNAIVDHFRNKIKVVEKEEYKDLQENDEGEDLTRQFSGCIVPMIRSLPEKYRSALELSELEGLPQKELAEKLNISYSGAKSRVQRGREKLKEVLLECCEIESDKYGNIIDYHSRKK